MKNFTDTAELSKVTPWDRSFSRFTSVEEFRVQMDLETTALYYSLQDSQAPNLPNETLIRITHKHSVMHIWGQ